MTCTKTGPDLQQGLSLTDSLIFLGIFAGIKRQNVEISSN
jgi:hypothetical protein